MTFDELNELDLSEIGDLPIAIKLAVVVFICALLVGAWYYFSIQSQYEELSKVERTEETLKEEFELKQSRAANLEAYRLQLTEMTESFGAMVRQLPNQTEVAGLLVDVSQTGLASGLEFELFQPQGEAPRDFYAELPIKLKVTGNYHEFGEFVSGLAALPRIVTIHDIVLKPKSSRSGSKSKMTLEATAKTYRYLDDGGR